MDNKKLEWYSLVFFATIITSLFRFYYYEYKKRAQLITQMLFAIMVAFAFMPAIADWLSLTQNQSVAAASLLTFFFDKTIELAFNKTFKTLDPDIKYEPKNNNKDGHTY